MKYLTSYQEYKDFLSLNLIQDQHNSLDFHFEKTETIDIGSHIQFLGNYHFELGQETLIINTQTASWAIFNELETSLINKLFSHGQHYTFLDDLDISKPKLIKFLKKMYNRGLVAINGKLPYSNELYSHTIPFRETLLAELLLSNRCNLSCPYCQSNAHPLNKDMPQEIIKKSIKQIFELPYRQILLELSGGEPFLNSQGLYYAVRLAQGFAKNTQKQVLINVVSNGTLLNEEHIKFIKNNQIKLTLSIDGPPDLHNRSRPLLKKGKSWNLIAKNIRLLQKENTGFNIVFTVNRYNCSVYQRTFSFLNGLQPKTIKFNPVFAVGNASGNSQITISSLEYFEFMKQLLDELLNDHIHLREHILCEMINRLITRYRDYRCMRFQCNAAKSYFVINPEGDIFPCASMTEFPSARLGNISNIDLKAESNWNENLVFKQLKKRFSQKPEKCINCPLLNFCMGGCTAYKLYESGPANSLAADRDQYCGFYYEMYTHIFKCISKKTSQMDFFLGNKNFGYFPGRVIHENYLS